MFTGIVEQTGEIVSVEADEGGRRVRIQAGLDDLHHGQSIAISGVCLTVEAYGEDWFELFLSQETIEKTYLGEVADGDLVNVERALPADGRFDGHVVQGHVDTTTEVTEITQVGDDWEFRFAVPEGFEQYLVPKGSITVDGISLTIADLDSDEFGVAIIPATYDITTLSAKSVGDPVHIEVDVVAKYVESMLQGDGDHQTPYAERFD